MSNMSTNGNENSGNNGDFDPQADARASTHSQAKILESVLGPDKATSSLTVPVSLGELTDRTR